MGVDGFAQQRTLFTVGSAIIHAIIHARLGGARVDGVGARGRAGLSDARGRAGYR